MTAETHRPENDDGLGRYKCPDCGHIQEPGGTFPYTCPSCVSIATRILLARARAAKAAGLEIPKPPNWTLWNLVSKAHVGSSFFDVGEDSLSAIRVETEPNAPAESVV
mgnify:CR=1 FL=1